MRKLKTRTSFTNHWQKIGAIHSVMNFTVYPNNLLGAVEWSADLEGTFRLHNQMIPIVRNCTKSPNFHFPTVPFLISLWGSGIVARILMKTPQYSLLQWYLVLPSFDLMTVLRLYTDSPEHTSKESFFFLAPWIIPWLQTKNKVNNVSQPLSHVLNLDMVIHAANPNTLEKGRGKRTSNSSQPPHKLRG